MARVKKITASELKKIIYEEKAKLGLLTKDKLSESKLIMRQVRALQFLKENSKKFNSERIKKLRKAIKIELLRSL